MRLFHTTKVHRYLDIIYNRVVIL